MHKKRRWSSTLSALGILAICSPSVSAHAVVTPVPLHQATLLTKPLVHVLLPHHSSTTATFLYHTPGASGTTNAAIQLRNQQILAGYNSAGAAAVVQQITNGHLFGTSYYGTGHNTYQAGSVGPPSYLALGNNPLNTGYSGGGALSIPGYNTPSFSFSPSQVIANARTGTFAFATGKPSYQSGALRAIANQVKGNVETGLRIGNSQFANFFSKNTVVGGEVAGTYYEAFTPTTYSLYNGASYGSNFIFAFGNNPLNTLTKNFSGTVFPSSFFTFSNGQTLNILGGQLALTRYTYSSGTTFTYTGARFLAIGNSPYNNFLNSTIAPKQVSFLEFATAKIK